MATFQIHSRDGVNFVEVGLNNEMVRTESGAMRYILGRIQMESKAASGGIGGIFKAALAGESIVRPTYTGTGTLVLEPTVYSFYELALNNDSLVLDRGAYWASEASVNVEARANKAITGIMSGEGLIQTVVSGTGKVIISVPGPVDILDMVNDRLVVDGTFAVARSTSLNFTVQRSTKSLLGSAASGEGLVNVFEGTGRVYLAPVPNLYVMLQSMMASAAAATASG
jgi:uncharacterized protein (AIM24 family)